jgi:hypothetical protein
VQAAAVLEVVVLGAEVLAVAVAVDFQAVALQGDGNGKLGRKSIE